MPIEDECPVCGALEQRLAVITGLGWLAGRSWLLCFRCYARVRALLDRALIREAQGDLAPPALNEHEKALCRMLDIDPAEMENQLPNGVWTTDLVHE